MRVMVPCETDEGLDSYRSGRPGHCPWLVVAHLDEAGALLDVEVLPGVGEGATAADVAARVIELGADALIVAGTQDLPLETLKCAGVRVVLDRVTAGVRDVLVKYGKGDVVDAMPHPGA